ncbi:MAG: inosine/xanthosine triphosphatase [Nitrososphaeria archaeon]|nr:inosine/xanthosine triphosphatase [Conexivisphaerales archaeon]
MIVGVGTSNNLKVEATLEAFRIFFSDVSVKGVEVDPEVPAQPFNEMLFTGAKNRALKSLKIVNADFGVGIEGGALELYGNRFITTAVCIVRKDGVLSYGMTGSFPVPDSVWTELKEGRELGDVIDSMTGMKDLKKGLGAIGIYTKGKVTRKDYLREGVIMALVRFTADENWF